jgi:hypothetical protein
MKYWQVAAGEGARDYSDVFLRYGIMLIGSGNPGSYFGNEDYYRSRPWGAQVVRFAKYVAEDDRVILKRPHHRRKLEEEKWQIQAVGYVAGDYEYVEQFDDVEGWDLQHYRKVKWVCPNEEMLTNSLTMGTFKRVYKREAIEKAEKILEEGNQQVTEEIPQPAKRISDEDLVEGLIAKGLRPADAETVIQTIWRVRRLARWYARYGHDLSEHEIRTFLIVPILLALGWSEQKIKIEWKNTDMSFFNEVYKSGGKPSMILESKRMGEGLHYAERQLVKYAKMFPECHHLVASDGIRYRLYVKHGSEQDFSAYANLLNLKDRHPYLEHIGGAPDLFISLMPK